MDKDYTKILLQIKGTLQGIDQSLYHLSNDINKIVTQILKENKENDE